MDKFIVNIIHRPEMVPEYSATVTGQGKEEDIGDKALLTESLDIFKTQQRLAHENGLKVTIQMTYASLFNDEAVEIAKHDHEVYGDEIALSLLGLPCEEFREKYKTKDFCIWMFSMEDKKAIVNDVFEKFHGKHPDTEIFCLIFLTELFARQSQKGKCDFVSIDFMIMFCDLNRFIVKQRSICHLNGNFQAILMCQSLLCLENIERLCK